MAKDGRVVGYTLLELLIVLAIIGILATVGSHTLAPLVRQERSVQAVMDLRNLINYARTMAIIRQAEVTLCALDEASRCVRDWSDRDIAVFIDSDEDHSSDNGEEVLRQVFWSAARGHLRWRAALARPYLVFKHWGNTAQNGSFYYCPHRGSDRDAVAVIVNRAGRNYVAQDRNRDGIRESAGGTALSCD